MKKIALLVAIFTFSIGFSTLVMANCPDKIDFNKIHIEWSDEFDGTELNKDNWECQTGDGSSYGIPGWGNNEQQWYREENVTVADGLLAITAKEEKRGTKNYTSGRIRTWDKDGNKPKVSVGMGYVEARMKIPSAKGIWPAFWMLGNNGKTWPSCGEIDIEESFNVAKFAQATIHYPDAKGGDVYKYVQTNPSGYDKTGWNTYGVYRDGNGIAFYLNGVNYAYWSTKDDSTGMKSVLNDDYHILLNFAVGGNLAGGIPDAGTLPLTMYVDYVRYYQEGAPETTSAAPTSATPTQKPTQKPTTVSAPAKAKIKSLKNIKKKKLKITLKKVKGAAGYQIRWCDNKKYDGYEQKTTKKLKFTIKGLDKKTTYWVKARAYKKTKGAKLYGKWSASKKKKVKK